jgi:AraC-like DNA-binding protein
MRATAAALEPFTLARHAAASPLGQISLAGFARDGRGIPRRPMRVLGAYAVVYVMDGGGRYEDANGLQTRLRAGDLLVVFPDLPHAYGKDGPDPWTELYFVFDGPVFDLWRQSGLLDPRRPIFHLEPIEYWLGRFETVLGALPPPGYAPALAEVCRLQTVLAEALLGGPDGVDEESAWVHRACALLESDLGRDLDLGELARELSMSYEGFRKRFRRHLDLSPGRYRSVRVIDRACELMQHGTLTDRQIAERLGFCDEFYFSRRFKQITGRSPRHWRESLPRTH